MSTRFWRSPSFEQTWFPFTQGCLVPSLVKTLKLNIFLLLCLMTLEKMCSLLIFLSHCQSEKKTSSPEKLFFTRATFQQIIQGYWEVKKKFKDQQDDLELWQCDLHIRHSLYQVWQLYSKGVKRNNYMYWADICTNTSSFTWPLTMWPENQ